MIKILLYSHSIDYAGTWRSHERVFEALDREKFDPYVFYWPGSPHHNRLEEFKKKIDDDHLIAFDRSQEQGDHFNGYTPITSNFAEKAREIGFDIILFTRSGYYEWPFNERIAPLQVEISVFDAVDNSPYLDRSIAISNKVNERKGYKSDCVIYYPIPKPSDKYDELDDLKEELDIPEDHFILGRIGRPAEFDPIALEAFKKLLDSGVKAKYIIVAPSQEVVPVAESLGLSCGIYGDVIITSPTNDDEYIERFYKTIDVFAHYRNGGESFGVGIGQALAYGKPVVSHFSGFNAQEEIIGDGGCVVNTADQYYFALKSLQTPLVRINTSFKARRRAQDFEQYKVTKQIEDKLIGWMND